VVKRTLLLFGPLRDRFGTSSKQIEVPDSQTVRSLLMHLEIDPMFVKTALDGVICDLDTEFGDATEIAILPPVSGG